jgi:hypothetical protein
MANSAMQVHFKWLFSYKLKVWIVAVYRSIFKKEPYDVKMLSFCLYPKYYPFLSKLLGIKKFWVVVYWLKVYYI